MDRRRTWGDHTRIGGDLKPTLDTYDELQRAFDFFNTELFAGRLPQCLITLSRQHDTYGYFSANQFVNLGEEGKGEYCHEITLNPSYFAVRSIPESLSIMAREMVSLDQLLNTEGKPPRRRYRNREWADMCEAIGLMPSDTGKPGGKRVGDSVDTYIIDGGLFDVASAKLVDSEFKLSWVDRYPPEQSIEEFEAPAATGFTDLGGGHAPAHAQAAESASHANPLDQLDEMDRDTDESGALLDVTGEGDLPTPSKSVNAFKKVADPDPEGPDDAPRMKVFAHAQTAELAQMGIEPKKTVKNPSKSKYSCTVKTCKGNVWGKPGMRVSCMGTEKKAHEPELMVFDGAASQEESVEPVEVF
jgi:hypothetical protein